MTVPCVIGLFLAWTLIPSNVAGRTKRTLTSSITFVGYCVGNMVGSQIFKEKDAVCFHPFPCQPIPPQRYALEARLTTDEPYHHSPATFPERSVALCASRSSSSFSPRGGPCLCCETGAATRRCARRGSVRRIGSPGARSSGRWTTPISRTLT